MMAQVQAWIRAVTFRDPLEQQQSSLVQTLLLALIAMTVIATPLPFLTELPLPQAFAVESLVLLELPLYIIALVVLRRGDFSHAVLLSSVSIVVLCVGLLFATGTHSSGATMFTFALPIIFAGLLVGHRGALWSVGLSLAGIGGVIVLEIAGTPWVGFAAPHGENIGGVLGGFLAIAVVLGVFVTHFGHMLRTALRAALEREHEIIVQRDTLENMVGERTADLRSVLAEVEARAAEQATLLNEIAQQREAIRELSVPLLPVDAHTLVLPLIGVLDRARIQTLQERALLAVQGGMIRRLILDISGVLLVDNEIAEGLLNVIHAARFLGVEVSVAGIRPEVAQTLVGLRLDFDNVRTYRDLEGALHHRIRLPGV